MEIYNRSANINDDYFKGANHMNPFLVVGAVLGGTVIFYLFFLGIGFAGVSANRKAQGLDKSSDR